LALRVGAEPERIRLRVQIAGGNRIVRSLLRQLVLGDRGQDLVEYALLAVFVALVGAAGWAAIENAIQNGYIAWDTAEQDLWEPPNP
jgi:Flp pilus assembly pilin Flp